MKGCLRKGRARFVLGLLSMRLASYLRPRLGGSVQGGGLLAGGVGRRGGERSDGSGGAPGRERDAPENASHVHQELIAGGAGQRRGVKGGRGSGCCGRGRGGGRADDGSRCPMRA